MRIDEMTPDELDNYLAEEEKTIDRKQVLYLRMIPGKAPTIVLDKPRDSIVKRLLALSEYGTLLVISSVQVPMISCTYTLHPGNHDELAIMSQHIGGLYA